MFVLKSLTRILIHALVGNNRRPRGRYRNQSTQTSQNSRVIHVRPFDADSAEPVIEKTVLSGRVHVIDGDTIIVNKTQIRLFGIDAPELNHPFGQKAKWALVSLCKNQIVDAEISEVDEYGRTVARCNFRDGRDLSAEMVKLGLAIDWPKFSCGIYQELEVQDVRKKLWLADARQKGRMHVWKKFEERQKRDNSAE